MVVVPTDEPVLVTGATGYFAGVLIRDLLEAGATVHGTVRDKNDTSSYQHILDLPGAVERFKLFQADLLKAGSFRDAMTGCVIVFHTASPHPPKIKDSYKEVIAPAIKGTKNVINQARKLSSVKRIVLTSSIQAMYTDAMDVIESESGVLDESFWNETATRDYQPYAFGKTEAEKDAWGKMEKQDSWDLITICPGLILGPGVKCHRNSYSVSLIAAMGNGTYKRGIPELATACVDVREVSKAHLEAAFRPEANGRYLIANPYETTDYFVLSQMLKENFPESDDGPEWPMAPSAKNFIWALGPWMDLPRKYVSRNVGFQLQIDASRSERELEIHYRSLSETLIDMARQIIADGLWSKEHMAEEARLARLEAQRLQELEKEAKAKRKELRLAKEAEEREKVKQERLIEKERLREEREKAKEERLRRRQGRNGEYLSQNGSSQEQAADMV